MLRFNPELVPKSQELVLYWTAETSTRCVLVTDQNRLELRILRDGGVVRRKTDIDLRLVRDTARQWQVEYELAHRPAAADPAEPPCPDCGDSASTPYARYAGSEQRTCRTCGYDWSSPCRG